MRAREGLSKPDTSRAPTARELYSQEELDRFLGLIRDGVPRHVAARSINSTGTLMRQLARPERDPWFAEVYLEAANEGGQFYADRLASEARARALGGSDRMLTIELATHGSEKYGHLRRDRMKVEGTIQHEHAITIVLDPAELDTWETEELEAFQAQLAKLRPQELPPGGAERPAEAA